MTRKQLLLLCTLLIVCALFLWPDETTPIEKTFVVCLSLLTAWLISERVND